MDITLETTIADLLNSRPDMKDILIAINPKFKKLNNPVLRRTLARLATVKQAAVVGGMDAADLLNQIRIAIGEEPINTADIEVEHKEEGNAPKWAKKKPKAILDANILLDHDKNPLAEISKEMHHLKKGDVIGVAADFKPEPLIDEMLKRGYKVYTQETDKGFLTYIKKH